MPQQPVTYMYVGPRTFDELFGSSLPYIHPQVVSAQNVHEMFVLLSDHNIVNLALLVDISQLSNIRSLGTPEVISSIRTLLDSHRLTTGLRPNPDALCVSMVVQASTPHKDLREIMSSNVSCVCPVGVGSDQRDTRAAIAGWFSGTPFIPKYVKNITSTVKTTEGSTISLTPRQAQLLHLMVSRGADNKTLARLVGVSVDTVKLHLGAIYRKYGVRSRAQLIAITKIDA